MEISEVELTWINSAVDKSPEAYFRTFEMNEKLSAHRRYIQLLKSDKNLSDVDRRTLVENFEWWKSSNNGQQFWLDRRTHLSTMRTTGVLVEAAETYAWQSFRRNALCNESNQQQGMFYVHRFFKHILSSQVTHDCLIFLLV